MNRRNFVGGSIAALLGLVVAKPSPSIEDTIDHVLSLDEYKDMRTWCVYHIDEQTRKEIYKFGFV